MENESAVPSLLKGRDRRDFLVVPFLLQRNITWPPVSHFFGGKSNMQSCCVWPLFGSTPTAGGVWISHFTKKIYRQPTHWDRHATRATGCIIVDNFPRLFFFIYFFNYSYGHPQTGIIGKCKELSATESGLLNKCYHAGYLL